MELLHAAISRSVLGRFYFVYNQLGYGHLEAACTGALEIALVKAGHRVARELPVSVTYEGTVVGNYRADLLVDRVLLVEVKATSRILEEHERQVRNYLKCSDLEVALLLNFGPKPEFRRFLLTNDRKKERVADPWPLPSDL